MARVLMFSTAAIAAEPPTQDEDVDRLSHKLQVLKRIQPEMAKAIERCVDLGLAIPRAAS